MHIRKIILLAMLLSTFIHASDNEVQSDQAKKSEDSQSEIIALTPDQIADCQIEILKVSPATLQQTFSVPAKITVNELRQAVVVAKAPGIVSKVSKNIGDAVQVDDILAVLESKEIAEAKAAYITAVKREALATKTLSAEEILKEKKISSEQNYLQILLAAEEARLNLEIAVQQLFLLGMNTTDLHQLMKDGRNGLCCYPIKANMNGVIIEKNINLGSRIGSDQEVYKIADLDTVWVELGLYANSLIQIKPGHKIFLRPIKENYPRAQAEITHVSPVIDEHTRTATAIALLSNTSREWCPGSFVRAEVVALEFLAPTAVLKEAIQEIEGKTYLFVKHPEGFEKREVKTGRSDKVYIEILSGVEPKTPYAASNAFILKAEHGKKDAEL